MTLKTIEVAERIMMSAQRDMWALADAVLEDVPEAKGTNQHSPGGGGNLVPDKLAQLAIELTDHGITKTDGTPYMPSYLRDLRDVANRWPPHERQAEASFDAHRENTGASREVFLALCAAARGEDVERPTGIEAKAWKAALDKMATRTRGWKVQTQAVRMAMQKGAKNAPTRLDGATFIELVNHLTLGLEGLQTFADRIASYELDDDDRLAMLKLATRLRDKTTMVIDVLAASASDDALAALLAEEGAL